MYTLKNNTFNFLKIDWESYISFQMVSNSYRMIIIIIEIIIITIINY